EMCRQQHWGGSRAYQCSSERYWMRETGRLLLTEDPKDDRIYCYSSPASLRNDVKQRIPRRRTARLCRRSDPAVPRNDIKSYAASTSGMLTRCSLRNHTCNSLVRRTSLTTKSFVP